MAYCKYCHREITEEVLAEKRRRKVENALNSLAKAKENGIFPIGRKSKVDWATVNNLRKQYFKFSHIAKIVGVSRSYIARECKRRGIK